MQITVPRVVTLMDAIGEAIRDIFPPRYLVGEEINADFRKILGHSAKHGGLCIPDPQMSADSVYNTSKAARGELLESILGGSTLNYVSHRACVYG